ncbi:MAG TPA: S9 family peptidase [Bryobacteraceae bacterium]|nr:S9 family peptidase [Bryobacteraceae bacterium]
MRYGVRQSSKMAILESTSHSAGDSLAIKHLLALLTLGLCLGPTVHAALAAGLTSADLYRLRSVGEIRLSPDGAYVAYTVSHRDGGGRPYEQVQVMPLNGGQTVVLAKGKDESSMVEWSRDGRWLAYSGKLGEKAGLILCRPDGSGARWIAPLEWTNSPMQEPGHRLAWAPDGKQIAFVSTLPGPETAEASGDPVVITRYLYKPDYTEGLTHFNDNRRSHIFIVDLESGKVRQLTTGNHYEHSIDWSPDGREILFVSNPSPDEDLFFNSDVFAVKAAGGTIRRITATESAEYVPRWSPDGKQIAFLGTRRGLTDLETTMEDTHVWVMNSDGSGRREVGTVVDNRQGPPEWTPDGEFVYFTVQERGSVLLCRIPAAGGPAERVIAERGAVRSWSLTAGGLLSYAFTSSHDEVELFLRKGDVTKQLTDLNADVLRGKEIAPVERFTFVSNDFKFEVEGFLTKPLGMTGTSRHPLIVVIHGGPHGQQGPGFNFHNQVYAAQGWATLMVNYRGSTGYGQKFADGVFGDQNGNEAQDVLYGVNAATRRYFWLDRDRMGIEGGSYGGQLTAWLVTQTNIFKAAIPLAPIINLVSYNYTTYYNMYEEMEFGAKVHQGNLMDVLWERSALKHVAQVRTPVMLLHGENDADVPITESEQFYIALKDVGVDAVMVRYPREGHGLREPKHIVDGIDRSIAWYRKYFPRETVSEAAGR